MKYTISNKMDRIFNHSGTTESNLPTLSPSERKLLQHIAEGNTTFEQLRQFLTTAKGKISFSDAEQLLARVLSSMVADGVLYSRGKDAQYSLTEKGKKLLNSAVQSSPERSYPGGYYANYSEIQVECGKSADVKFLDTFDDLNTIVSGDAKLFGKKRNNKSDDDRFY